MISSLFANLPLLPRAAAQAGLLGLPSDVFALLSATAFGCLAVGFGVAWLLKPSSSDPEAPRSVFADLAQTRDLAAALPAKRESGRITGRPTSVGGRAARRPSAGGRAAVAKPASDDFDRWKGQKRVEELQDENTELRNLMTLLPGLTKRVTETLSRREIIGLIADMVPRLCIPPPDKVIVFVATSGGRQLAVAAHLGYEAAQMQVYDGLRVGTDKGLISLAARRQVTVDTRDPERDAHSRVEPGNFPFGVEIAAPIVHNRRILGMITVEGLPGASRFAKRMVTVAANLGAVALANADIRGQIQRMADSDALTGLFNKRYFFEQIAKFLEVARTRRLKVSLFMFDIDNFKHYNDRNGHQAGDEALKLTGKLLREHVKEGQLAARYGGEEFILVMPGLDREAALACAEKFLETLTETNFPHGEAQPLGLVSVSGGIATFPEDGDKGSALIEHADANLYKAKKAGKNRVVSE
ncbi:MAG: GGDEF domain-containing protein [Planctomycetota bacterium]|jgi:diguanylate cyclase (GGDEF)-like protein